MCAERISHPLPPVCYPDSKVLILGSFPSPKSRELGFYYGNPQNRFWLTLARVWDEPMPWGASPAETNGARLAFCRSHHIALWDVLASCTIEGASDASITNPIPNEIASLVQNSSIAAVFCTGATAAKFYKSLAADSVGMDCVRLPSTSPANASWSVERLVEAYREVRVVVETGALNPSLGEPGPELRGAAKARGSAELDPAVRRAAGMKGKPVSKRKSQTKGKS